MQFSRVASCLIFFMTLGLFVFASPAPAGLELETRTGSNGGDTTAAIEEVLSTLESVTSEILTEIESLVGHNNATFGGIEPLILGIEQAVNTAHVSLLVFGTGSLGSGINATEITALVGEIIQEIYTSFDLLDSSLSGLLATSTSSCDSQLAGVLSQLSGLIPNFLSLVSSLLENVGGITAGSLSSISFFFVAGLFAGAV